MTIALGWTDEGSLGWKKYFHITIPNMFILSVDKFYVVLNPMTWTCLSNFLYPKKVSFLITSSNDCNEEEVMWVVLVRLEIRAQSLRINRR